MCKFNILVAKENMLCLAFTIPTLIYQTGVSEEQLIWQEEGGSLGWGFFSLPLLFIKGGTLASSW